jgi:hypothetical protein
MKKTLVSILVLVAAVVAGLAVSVAAFHTGTGAQRVGDPTITNPLGWWDGHGPPPKNG